MSRRVLSAVIDKEKQSVKILHDKLKVYSLTGRITEELMLKAFKAVKKNRGAAGIDKISIAMYESNLTENLLSLMRELKLGTYQSIPLRRVHIPKGKGKTRPLGIPSVRCRVAQEVIRRVINPTFESRFHNNSFGFRSGRNCHQAVERLFELAGQGHRYVVDVDIKGFFDNIPHDLILESISARISDGNILRIIKKFLNSGVMEEGKIIPTLKGTPQGGVISPILSNIALDHLDWFLDEQKLLFVRYADDFVILCKTKLEAERALDLVRTFLKEMELEDSPEKTKIRHFSEGFDFLGFTIKSRSVQMRTKSKEKFMNTIRKITTRSRNLDGKVIDKLNRVIRGTVNYFGTKFSTMKTTFHKLDRWTRKRIRCMKYKRISQEDNWRCKIKYIKKMGLLSCDNLYRARLHC
ncbi:MAG: group II intron reverse transcriptase/maturase [Parachlamydiaceae bacterium]|nr:group II intron reverse transcriptase/maturase [Parachlamydiaceae bacterium]